jgi:hypothetical protein
MAVKALAHRTKSSQQLQARRMRLLKLHRQWVSNNTLAQQAIRRTLMAILITMELRLMGRLTRLLVTSKVLVSG